MEPRSPRSPGGSTDDRARQLSVSRSAPDQYQQISGLPIREVRIMETKVESERASVKLVGKVEVGALGWMPQPLTDEWVLIDGEWYHQTRKPPAEAKKIP